MTVAIIVALFLIVDSIVVIALVRAFTLPLQELAKQFPAVTPGPDAVRRNFQSFSFGLLNAGWSMHVAADEHHLHLSPVFIMRLFSIPPLSIPWTHIRFIKRGRWTSRVLIAGDREKLDVKGPRWCLDLASNPSSGATTT